MVVDAPKSFNAANSRNVTVGSIKAFGSFD